MTSDKSAGPETVIDAPTMSLGDFQQWTNVFGRIQQQMLEYLSDPKFKDLPGLKEMAGLKDMPGLNGMKLPSFQMPSLSTPSFPQGWNADISKMAELQKSFLEEGAKLFQGFMASGSTEARPANPAADKDKRFSAAEWRENPVFDLIRQSYLMLCDHLLKGIDVVEGVDDRQRDQIRFATRNFVEALSPSNFLFTNPEVIAKTIETRGENLVTGMSRIMDDISRGQLSHTNRDAFELGRNIAATPGKVVHETSLYQLIQYSPTTEQVNAIPLLIFPPWINRFYILDLNPKNSFIRWAVEQGLTVFVVSWKSADSSLAGTTMDDYVLNGVVDAINVVRSALNVPSVHAIGYCVAGTTLAMALSWLAANDQADAVASATYFTAQVDFSKGGELQLLVDDAQINLIDTLSAENGYLDGRYMAATFNMLRGRDLIWNYVVQNYMLGADYPAFDLLYWNGDTTNLPAKWHRDYLLSLYRDNRLVQPNSIEIAGTPIDLRRIKTPSYIQAGREDHIAPAQSVWKITEHLSGPIKFVLAGSGHIAGVVNPPSANKYQYWLGDSKAESLEAFVAGAKETAGSWWPDWREWIDSIDKKTVAAKGARIPGKGNLKAIEDAPGTYVKTR